jgi:hypothetical protein
MIHHAHQHKDHKKCRTCGEKTTAYIAPGGSLFSSTAGTESEAYAGAEEPLTNMPSEDSVMGALMFGSPPAVARYTSRTMDIFKRAASVVWLRPNDRVDRVKSPGPHMGSFSKKKNEIA